MTNTLNGVHINVEESTPRYAPKVNRTPIAATGRHQIHNLGVKNITWRLKCWVNNETDYDTIKALVGVSPITWIDKFGDSFQVEIISFGGGLKQHEFIKFDLSLEELA